MNLVLRRCQRCKRQIGVSGVFRRKKTHYFVRFDRCNATVPRKRTISTSALLECSGNLGLIFADFVFVAGNLNASRNMSAATSKHTLWGSWRMVIFFAMLTVCFLVLPWPVKSRVSPRLVDLLCSELWWVRSKQRTSNRALPVCQMLVYR